MFLTTAWHKFNDLVELIISSPLDSFLAINESIALIDWEEISDKFAYQTGIVLNFILFCSYFYYSTSSKDSDLDLGDFFSEKDFDFHSLDIDFLFSDNNSPQHGSVYVHWLINTVFTISIMINLVNSVVYLASMRSYHFHGTYIAGLHEKPETSSITKSIFVRAQNNSVGKWILNKIENFLKSKGRLLEGSTPELQPMNNPIARVSYKLALWNPPKFSILLFSVYSPLQILLLQFTTSFGIETVLMYITVSYLFYYMLNKYETKLKDKDIINREVMKEYQDRFVKPRLNKKMVDVMVDATNARMGSSIHFSPSVQNKIFLTHDFEGNLTDVLSPRKLPKSTLERMNGSRISTPMKPVQYPPMSPFRTPRAQHQSQSQFLRTPMTSSRIPVPIRTPGTATTARHNVTFNTPMRPIPSYQGGSVTPRATSPSKRLYPTTPRNNNHNNERHPRFG